jgi:hypothetical protein
MGETSPPWAVLYKAMVLDTASVALHALNNCLNEDSQVTISVSAYPLRPITYSRFRNVQRRVSKREN